MYLRSLFVSWYFQAYTLTQLCLDQVVSYAAVAGTLQKAKAITHFKHVGLLLQFGQEIFMSCLAE